MNRKQNSQKDINEYKIVVPMSNEAVNKIKSNITKSILGVSIAGVMIAGGATQVKAETAENPTAIVQEVKDERKDEYDKALAAAVENILPQNAQALNSDKKEEVALTSANGTSEEEASTDDNQSDDNGDKAADQEGLPEGKDNITLDEFIKDDTLDDLFNFDANEADAEENIDEEEKLEALEGNPAQAQKAGEEVTEPNYSDDEAKIQDYDEKNDYKKTDLEQGDTTQVLNKDDAGEEAKDGFKFETSNPSATSESLTEYGYAMVIDKKTGQRTYTLLYVTDSGRITVKTGDKPMMGEGDKLNDGSPEVTYKPNEDGILTDAGRQKNYNWNASEETLKHINNSGYTVIGMKDDYDQNNPKIKFFEGNSFNVVYKVNPWPNENDKLQLMELSGEYRDKVFVQGQEIKTNVKVDNMDENAKERIVGQVYNPITGKIVPGASAYIDDEGYVHIKMPEGALKKDENGKYVVNEESIFNTDDYKALQNLDVKFFARPRTKDEFTTIAQKDEYTPGTYVGTEAGEGVINHKGKDVTIDKQGIDRYDHYNLIGTLKIDLDDTRYYNQNFKDGNQKDTSDITSSPVKPGEEFHVGIYEKDKTDEFEKSADDMNGAESRGEAAGVLKMDFIDKLNEGKAEEDQWKVIVNPNDISNFSIIAPKSAKAGDFAAIPVEYTYTNGSKDVHWFHFVVQESDNNLPSYEVQVDYPSEEMDSTVTVEQNNKKNKPNKYTIDSKTYKDDQGNIWDVTINEATGEVTAKPQAKPDGKTFNGGEKLQVPVTVHYENTDEKETAFAEFVLKEKSNIEPDYDAKAGKAGDKLESNVIVDDNNYDRKPVKYTIEETKYTDAKGNEWTVSIDEKTGKVTATVPNAEEGKTIDLDGTMINVPVTAHYVDADGNEIGTKKANVQFLGSGTNGTHKVTEEIPFEIEVKKDPNLKSGEWKYAKDEAGNELRGEKGEKEKTLTIVDSKVTKTSDPTVTKEAKNAVILIGEGIEEGTHEIKEKGEIPFETRIEYDESLEAGKRVETDGTPGEKERTNTLVIKDGKVTETKEGEFKTTKEPVDRVIKIGIKPVEKEVETDYKTRIEYDPNLEAGKVEKTDGEKGKTKITTTFNQETNKLETTEEVVEKPKDEVIKIGTKKPEPAENTTEVSKEVGTKIEYVYDDSLELGEVILGDFTPGKVETKVVQKYDPATGKITAEEETTVTPGVQKIVVGTKKTDNTCPVPDPDPTDPTDPENPDDDNPGTPGGGEKPDENPDEKPDENPDEKPETPEEPDTPDTPGTPDEPGETPEEPGTPGETPDEQGTPGETSEELGESSENTDTPETIEKPEVDEVEESVDNPAETSEVTEEVSSDAKRLPKTGDGINVSLYGYLMGVLGSGFLGLGALKKKKEDEEEEN